MQANVTSFDVIVRHIKSFYGNIYLYGITDRYNICMISHRYAKKDLYGHQTYVNDNI